MKETADLRVFLAAVFLLHCFMVSLFYQIPKDIGKLIHLRHLNLQYCQNLVSLPETMCDLCNLQSLNISGCYSLKELPRVTVKLIKLRHLCIHRSGVAFMPKEIERLTCLQQLDCFIVCGGGENESKTSNLRELKNLDHIGGSLIIENLQGGGIEDAAEAQIKNKKRLLCLDLYFNHNHEDDNLIEVLQPPSDLERLSIYLYGGIVLPNWIMALIRLQELKLGAFTCGFENLEVLPPLGRLPNLESLDLNSVGVRRLDAGFVGIEEVEDANINEGEIATVTPFLKLKRLEISYLQEVEEWVGIDLKLIDCANLEVLPWLGRLPNLESLELEGLQDAGFLGIEEVENANVTEGEITRVTAFPKLKSLGIWNLFKLEEWDGIERRVGEKDAITTSIFIMPQLRVLMIYKCPLLRALPNYVLAAPLQLLDITECPNIILEGFIQCCIKLRMLLYKWIEIICKLFGMCPDFRVLVQKSRKQAEQYHRLYKEPIPVTQFMRETDVVMQEFTQSRSKFQFPEFITLSLILISQQLSSYVPASVDPSGSYFSWKASAMGENVSNAKTFIEKRYTDDMELDDAIHNAILILKEGFEGQISGENIETGKIGGESNSGMLFLDPFP
ncbi:hypothetical protein DKX38_020189 [Salix brachista]|uniref:Disease resistance R13L4/SHOC-2-like LRR domain-containing protein n=1 Tax=Salix brachista TaxID=2182728 RepID=A0A5N5KIL2_9ROSI|nr:hypothetical protein DKX38_020189 [Salix brachista]